MRLDLRKRLEQVLPVPTAPFHEDGILGLLKDFARSHGLRAREDAAGNLELIYGPGRPRLLYHAHTDHPALRANGDGTATAMGGIHVEQLVGHGLRTFDGGNSVEVSGVVRKQRPGKVRLKGGRGLKRGTPLILDLPGIRFTKHHVRARVIDDLASVAACLTVIDRLRKSRWKGTLGLLFTRAEEVGFVGATAWTKTTRYPKSTTIINLETSRALPHTPQGEGPIVRVGDFSSTFDPYVTLALRDAAQGLPHQRALMDGGNCEATVFCLAGFRAGAVCLPTKNIHNHKPRGGMGLEYVHKDDAENLVRLLARFAKGFASLDPTKRLRGRLEGLWKKHRKRL